MTEAESNKVSQWGAYTIKAVNADPYLTDAYRFVSRIPIIHWVFGIIELFLLRIWLWIHSLPLPGWIEWILYVIDRIIEKIVVVVSWIIHWIFGEREKQSKARAAANRHLAKQSGEEK